RLLPTADVSPPATISSSPPLPPLPPLSTLFPYTTLFRSPLIAREQLDLVVANAENAANGSGLTPRGYRQLRQAGVDLITMGDHVDRKSTRLNSSHGSISYAVFCLKKKKTPQYINTQRT